jgi:hypothetical protein
MPIIAAAAARNITPKITSTHFITVIAASQR